MIVKINKINKTLLALCVISFVIFTIFLVGLFTMNSQNDKLNEKYPNLNTDNVYEVISAKTLISIMDKKLDAIVILGFPACPWCQALLPIANEVAKENDIETIYYIDILDMRDNLESSDHQNYLIIKNRLIKAVDQKKDRINAPTTFVLKDGNLLSYNLDTIPSHIMNDNHVLPPLTDLQKQELKSLLKTMFIALK